MKILSRHKDYYDYLVGIWGEDEKLVLDRTNFTKIGEFFLNDRVIYCLHICGYQYDFYYMDGKFIHGKEILEYFPQKKREWWMRSFYHERSGNWASIPHSSGKSGYYDNHWMYTEPVKSYVNDILGVSVLIEHYTGKLAINEGHRNGKHYCPFPILKDMDFARIVPAEEIWQLLTNWLSKQLDKKIPDTQTDKQKIIGKGFDLIKSFRHRK